MIDERVFSNDGPRAQNHTFFVQQRLSIGDSNLMKGCISMTSFKNLLTAIAVLAIHAASAFGITSVKTVSLLHNNTNSPFFKTTADGFNTFLNYSDSGGTFTPVGDPLRRRVHFDHHSRSIFDSRQFDLSRWVDE